MSHSNIDNFLSQYFQLPVILHDLLQHVCFGIYFPWWENLSTEHTWSKQRSSVEFGDFCFSLLSVPRHIYFIFVDLHRQYKTTECLYPRVAIDSAQHSHGHTPKRNCNAQASVYINILFSLFTASEVAETILVCWQRRQKRILCEKLKGISLITTSRPFSFTCNSSFSWSVALN